MGKNQHVVPNGDYWSVIGEGNDKYTATYDTQQKAIEKGREIAINQKSELFIHNKEGKIRERSSYGNDPYPPIG